jgi:hypothetical protein
MTETLRALLADARAVLSANCDSGQCCGIRERIDAALAEPTTDPIADAYRRGAEAMREQAAMVDPYGLHLDRAEFARVISGPASIVQIIRAGIRALPIPEDT